MKNFRCETCGHPLFFENVQCLQCGSALAFLPDILALCAIEPAPEDNTVLKRKAPHGRKLRSAQRRYRQCANHTQHEACNFVVPAEDPNPLCVSCRQTRILPDLSVPGNQEKWYRIEVAKRRLFYTLARLRLLKREPPSGQSDGPTFEFLADVPGKPAMTGHSSGVITLNVAEADDTERVRRRVSLHEPYRTLLGHLRHESGHFYWDKLVQGNSQRLEDFRKMFGDEREDYAAALQRHYASGAKPNWEQEYVSAYAGSHPWEDWAETWAHYLHMIDLLETASAYNTAIALPGEEEAEEVDDPFDGPLDFDTLVEQWLPLTLLVNSLNRSLGQDDAYPFALSPRALEKLRFVHETIRTQRKAPDAPAAESPAPATAAQS